MGEPRQIGLRRNDNLSAKVNRSRFVRAVRARRYAEPVAPGEGGNDGDFAMGAEVGGEECFDGDELGFHLLLDHKVSGEHPHLAYFVGIEVAVKVFVHLFPGDHLHGDASAEVVLRKRDDAVAIVEEAHGEGSDARVDAKNNA